MLLCLRKFFVVPPFSSHHAGFIPYAHGYYTPVKINWMKKADFLPPTDSHSEPKQCGRGKRWSGQGVS
jgi:hypothetical protein